MAKSFQLGVHLKLQSVLGLLLLSYFTSPALAEMDWTASTQWNKNRTASYSTETVLMGGVRGELLVLGNYKQHPAIPLTSIERKGLDMKYHFIPYSTLYQKTGPQMEDIIAPAPQDSHFSAILQSIAYTRPDAIQNAIEKTNEGFKIPFYDMNHRKLIVQVDDSVLMPTRNRQGNIISASLKSAKTENGQQILWPLVYEKAFRIFEQHVGLSNLGHKGFEFLDETSSMRIGTAVTNKVQTFVTHQLTPQTFAEMIKKSASCPMIASTTTVWNQDIQERLQEYAMQTSFHLTWKLDTSYSILGADARGHLNILDAQSHNTVPMSMVDLMLVFETIQVMGDCELII